MRLRACLLLSVLLGGGAQAAQDRDACTGTIATLPATIATPGTWCLASDLATAQATGAAITLDADDITLDCNGFRLDGQAAGLSTQATGILGLGHDRLTVRHCHVRAFRIGIDVHPPGGTPTTRHLVEDNRLDASRLAAIWLEAPGSVVRRNLITNTIDPVEGQAAYGIRVDGDVDVLDNVIADVQASSGEVVGIYTRGNHGGSVRGNRVRNVHRNGGAGNVSGILDVLGSERMTLRGNTVLGEGQAGSYGIVCDAPTDRAKDNLVQGFPNGLYGCSDDGNTIKP